MELKLDQALQKGVEAHKAGKVQEADRYYTAILKAQPKHPDANHNMGVLAVGVGKVETALPFFKTAIEANPKIEQYWLSYIDALIKLDRMAEAKAVFDQARSKGFVGDGFDRLEQRFGSLEKDSAVDAASGKLKEPAETQLNSLINLYTQCQYQEVRTEALRLLKKYPNSINLYNLLGVANKSLGNLDEAIEAYDKAISIKPDYADAYNNLGAVLREQGNLDQAIEAYDKAISITPDYADAYYNMGVAHQQQGRLDIAIGLFKKAIALKPNYAVAFNNLGNALQEQGNLDQAIEAYDKAISITPDYADACYNMGVAHQQQGRLDIAIGLFKKAIALKPNYAAAFNNMGNALKNLGNSEDAIKAYTKALELKPDNPAATTNLAILLFESKKFEKAARLFCMNDSIQNQSYLLKCFYELNEKSKFYKQLDYLIDRGENNCVIGSYASRSEIRYGVTRENPFCNDPLNYVTKTDLTEKCDFKKIFVDNAANVLNSDEVGHKSQGHLKNGIQTSGNIFTQVGSVTNFWQDIIRSELSNYKDLFSDSEEGLIRDWPSDYSIFGWLVSMKNGGELSAHIHDTGWITGSIYINVPLKSKNDSGNLVVTTHDPEDGKGNAKDTKSIDVVTGSLCLFPSSLLHYTIPFESNDDRIVLAFDVIPNK